jgi:hypothetical protein
MATPLAELINFFVFLRQVYSLFQSEFSTEGELVLPLSVFSILCFVEAVQEP